jgi:hypothetical protein
LFKFGAAIIGATDLLFKDELAVCFFEGITLQIEVLLIS